MDRLNQTNTLPEKLVLQNEMLRSVANYKLGFRGYCMVCLPLSKI